jgi:hypothetical protein
VRWDDLFDDLVAQARTVEAGDVAAEVDDRARWEVGQLDVNDRVLARIDAPVTLVLVDGSLVPGRLVAAGADWLAVREPAGDALVPSTAVARVTLPPLTRDGGLPVRTRDRLGLVQLFRHAARDRAYVRLALRGGQVAAGTVDAAGADHVQLAEHDVDLPRRRRVVRSVSLVPYASLLVARGEGRWLG